MASFSLSNQWQALRSRYYRSPLPRFFKWWREELLLLLPAQVREFVSYQPEQAILVPGEDGFAIWQRGARKEGEIGRIRYDEDDALARQQWVSLLSGFDEDEPRIVLLLPNQEVLERKGRFPAAAEDNLRQVLSFEMDRTTPFKADQVFYDYKIVNRDTDHRMLDVVMVISPRDMAQREIDRARKFVTTLHRADVDANTGASEGQGMPHPAGYNLLPPEARTRPAARRLKINFALAGLALVLVAGAMLLSLTEKRASLEQLDRELAQARTEARAAVDLRTELQDAAEAAAFISMRRQDKALLIDALRETTRLLPDETYLQRLQLSDGEIKLQGQSTSANALISTLEESPQFSGTEFQGQSRVDQRTGKELFNIKVDIAAVSPPATALSQEIPPGAMPEPGSSDSGGAQSSPDLVPAPDDAILDGAVEEESARDESSPENGITPADDMDVEQPTPLEEAADGDAA